MKVSTKNKYILALCVLMGMAWGNSAEAQIMGTVCDGEQFCISIDDFRGTVQWQSSTDGTNFTDIPNETNDTLCQTGTAPLYYRGAITTEEGCPVTFSDTFQVSINDFSVTAGADSTICEGDSITLGGSPTGSGGMGPYTFTWTGNGIAVPSAENPVVAPTTMERYMLMGVDGDGCQAFDTVDVMVTPISTGSDTFQLNSAFYAWAVPPCISTVTLEAWGAAGSNGAGSNGGSGGRGGYAKGEFDVSAIDTLYIYVGGANGYNGGGTRGFNGIVNGGGGGGASDVRAGGQTLSDRVIVAGGGGGGGGDSFPSSTAGGNGGDGGGTNGGDGTPDGNAGSPTTPGEGGSQLAGGNGGAGSVTCNAPGGTGVDGMLGVGGKGGDATQGACSSPGATAGGGGGGYYGGGGGGGGSGGGHGAAGGGGGSSFIGGLTNASTVIGGNTSMSNGLVVISW